MNKDFSYNSGERQIGKNLSEIRIDHLLRYQLAKTFINLKPNSINTCLDIFCGNGYGSYFLAKSFPNINFVGVDGSIDAINFANQYYSNNNCSYEARLFPFSNSKLYDIIICFESLEHVEDDALLISLLYNSLKKDSYVILSVPNEKLHSLSLNPHPFHFRHYTYNDIINKIDGRFEMLQWYGQNVYEFTTNGINTHKLLCENEMRLLDGEEGQVNIYILKKIDE